MKKKRYTKALAYVLVAGLVFSHLQMPVYAAEMQNVTEQTEEASEVTTVVTDEEGDSQEEATNKVTDETQSSVTEEDIEESESTTVNDDVTEESSKEETETYSTEESDKEETETYLTEESTDEETETSITDEETESTTEQEFVEETTEEETTEEETTVEMVEALEACEATPENDFTWDGTTILTYTGSATEVVIPDKAQKISSRAFYNNATLESITIGENITSLGERAFADCSSLKTIKFETTKLNSVQTLAFAGCSINCVTFAEGTTNIPANLFNGAGFESGSSVEIPEDVTDIGNYAFNEAKNLSNITFAGNKVTRIGTYAFCQTGIEEISIPTSVKKIESRAFWKCSNLLGIVIPSNVTSLGERAFADCSGLKTVKFETTKLNSVQTLAFAGCSINSVTFAEGTINIPANLFNGAGFESGSSVEIPEGVTDIGNYAFNEAKNLSNITFAGNKVTRIGIYAFCQTGIEEISIPTSVKKIESRAFMNCINLLEIVVPSSVTSIGESAFAGCSSLTKAVIPASVKTIGYYAFGNNSNLKIYVVTNSYAHKWAVQNGFTVVETFSITYKLNGGTNAAGNPSVYETGEALSFEDPTREGYTFGGWFTDSGCRKPFTYIDTTKGNLTLYAKWNIITYNITYEANGGTLAKNSPVTYMVTSNIVLKNPTKAGYAFTGWYTDENCTQESLIKKITKGTTGDVTLYAGWREYSYSIKFAVNGTKVTGTQDMITGVAFSQSITLPACNYIRTGYEFKEWNTKPNGKGQGFADEAAVEKLCAKDKGVVTLYAIWNINKYNINYMTNGGTLAKNTPLTYDVTKRIALNNPTRTGYTFNGWYTDEACTQENRIKAINQGTIGDVTVYADWIENSYTIKFAVNGSKVSGSRETLINIGYDEEVVLEENTYTRAGYEFAGWNTKANGTGISYADGATVKNLCAKHKGTITLYAMWEAIPYNITYYLDGGDNNVKNPATYTIAKAVSLTNPTKTGYTFKGWYTDESFSTKITSIRAGSMGDVSVYAKWQVNSYKIAFNANQGKGRMSALTNCIYDQKYTLPENQFTRSGYTFTGWNTKANGTGTAFADAAEVEKLIAANGKTVTLYAQWEKQ